jgi:hypothetical protein
MNSAFRLRLRLPLVLVAAFYAFAAAPVSPAAAQVPQTTAPRQICIDGIAEVGRSMSEVTDRVDFARVKDMLRKMELAREGQKFDECLKLLSESHLILSRY